MEIGLSTYLFVNQRLTSHILDQIHGAEIHQIEIFAARQHLDYREANHVRDVAQWFADHGVSLYSVHVPLFTDFDWGRSAGLRFLSPIPKRGCALIRWMKSSVSSKSLSAFPFAISFATWVWQMKSTTCASSTQRLPHSNI